MNIQKCKFCCNDVVDDYYWFMNIVNKEYNSGKICPKCLNKLYFITHDELILNKGFCLWCNKNILRKTHSDVIILFHRKNCNNHIDGKICKNCYDENFKGYDIGK